MGSAYTPGLTVSPGASIRKIRRLPLKGEVFCEIGDEVRAEAAVARAEIPGIIQTVRVAESLGLEPSDAIAALKVAQGDAIEAGRIVAESRSFFGLFRSECRSQFAGTVELISKATGHIGVRLPPRPVEVNAYIDGKVVEVMPEEGVVVETFGALVQGIFGIGRERGGVLRVAVGSPDVELTAEHIDESHAGCVVVGGSGATREALAKAAEVGAAGVVAGAIRDSVLVDYLGHDVGVAITGQEDVPCTVILTEGFGNIAMAQRTFDLLKSLDGKKASINGATQVRAGVIRPEIVVPLEVAAAGGSGAVSEQALEVGSRIRIIREPHFGALGNVTALPSAPVEVESGAVVRILEAKLDNGGIATVPRANVEIISE